MVGNRILLPSIHVFMIIVIVYSRFQMLGSYSDVDPEVLFTKQEKIGKGSFGEVFKG